MESLVEEIKQKKELQSLSEDFVGSITKEYLSKEKVDLSKKSGRKQVVKNVRKILREVYGAFKTSRFKKREKLLNELGGKEDLETHDKILKLHVSTQERLPHYYEVYRNIFSLTGKPKSILDLGCGLNPLSYPYMDLGKVKYYASELTQDDSDFIQKYLDKIGLEGKTFPMDLTEIGDLPGADVCFLFKLLDTLETLNPNLTKELIARLPTKWLVVSFPLKSLGGRKTMSKKRLVWFERIIKDLKYETFEVTNEIFYVIRL